MSDWLYVSHPETGGSTRVPDQPGVRERYEALGWVVGDDPDDGSPFVPPKAVEQNEEDGWVTLYHCETHAAHRFPSHPDAVEGAYEVGWRVTPPKHPEPDPDPDAPADDDGPDKAEKTSPKLAPAKKAGDKQATTEEGE